MKKLVFLGFILTMFSVAVSAQEASGESSRHHRVEESYRNGDLTRPEMNRLDRDHHRYDREKNRDFRDGRISRSERHRLHRMHRHERREMHRFHHRHHHRRF